MVDTPTEPLGGSGKAEVKYQRFSGGNSLFMCLSLLRVPSRNMVNIVKDKLLRNSHLVPAPCSDCTHTSITPHQIPRSQSLARCRTRDGIQTDPQPSPIPQQSKSVRTNCSALGTDFIVTRLRLSTQAMGIDSKDSHPATQINIAPRRKLV
jgi:hypothetical protein